MKYLISTLIILVIIVTVGMFLWPHMNIPQRATFLSQSAPVIDPVKLFSVGVGTSTADGRSKVGVFVDERTIPKYDHFYFPASFAVDKDSNSVIFLDSARSRIVIFALDGQYRGEVKFPNSMHAIDLAWFPKTQTMLLLFQEKPVLGVINVDITNGIKIKSNSTYSIPEALGLKSISDVIMHIWPVNIQDPANDYFTLDMDSSKLSDPLLVLENNKLDQVSGSDNSLLTKTISSSSTDSIPKSLNGNKLRALRFVGTDILGNTYLIGDYSSQTIELSGRMIVYKISPIGAIVGKLEVFSSPKMLSNRYMFVDSQGSIYYMHLDDKSTIGIYKYEINSVVAPATSAKTSFVVGITQQATLLWSQFISNTKILLVTLGLVAIIIISVLLILIIKWYKKKQSVLPTQDLRPDQKSHKKLIIVLTLLIVLVCGYLVWNNWRQVMSYFGLDNGITITFDKLDTTMGSKNEVGRSELIPRSFAGLDWDYLEVINSGSSTIESGYKTDLISSPNVIYNPNGEIETISDKNGTFDLISAYMSAAWLDGLKVEVQGFNNHKMIYDNTYSLNPKETQRIRFNYYNIDQVTFIPSGGTANPQFTDPFNNSHEEFVIDDLRVGGNLLASTTSTGL